MAGIKTTVRRKAGSKVKPATKLTLQERVASLEKELKVAHNTEGIGRAVQAAAKDAHTAAKEADAAAEAAKAAKTDLQETIDRVQIMISHWRLQVFGETKI